MMTSQRTIISLILIALTSVFYHIYA